MKKEDSQRKKPKQNQGKIQTRLEAQTSIKSKGKIRQLSHIIGKISGEKEEIDTNSHIIGNISGGKRYGISDTKGNKSDFHIQSKIKWE